MMGQCAALVTREMPAAEIIQEVMSQARERIKAGVAWA